VDEPGLLRKNFLTKLFCSFVSMAPLYADLGALFFEAAHIKKDESLTLFLYWSY
jgi:hypothetical protein